MTFEMLLHKPFNLDDTALAWVKDTFVKLTEEDKLRQLFNLISAGNDPENIATIEAFRPGGITRMMTADSASEKALIANINAAVSVPLLVSADLEGSRMSLANGAQWPNPLALAAIDDVKVTENVSRRMAQEARNMGINWSFTPVVDINFAFRSAIVATRGFGSDVNRIEQHALAQLQVFQQNGIAATVKHWPGEGVDDRDQHLVTTVNSLDVEAWKQSFGRLYQTAIDLGVLSIMSAHIAFPQYVKSVLGDCGVEAFRPASISKLLNQNLLRDEMGFNGLIVSDATPMAGLGSWSRRADHLPELIAAGCDVILFSDNPDQDLEFLRRALEEGRLSQARVDEAVIRQLGMKAALGLDRPQQPIGDTGFDAQPDYALASKVAQMAPTLVKDVQDLLPLDPVKHRRVLIFSGGISIPFFPQPLPFDLPDLLTKEGFEVTVYDDEIVVDDEKFDLILYLFGDETLLTRGRIFLNWLALTGHFGKAMQRYWHDIPTAMISFGYPYLLYDAPRVPTYVNAYSTTVTMQQAVVELLMGRSEWNTDSPVDPFCGLEDARY